MARPRTLTDEERLERKRGRLRAWRDKQAVDARVLQDEFQERLPQASLMTDEQLMNLVDLKAQVDELEEKHRIAIAKQVEANNAYYAKFNKPHAGRKRSRVEQRLRKQIQVLRDEIIKRQDCDH